MTSARSPDVEAFLGRLTPGTKPIVLALREVIRRVVPRAAESVVWGALSYHRPWIGGRVRGAVCQIVVKRDRVRLDFIHGARLPDPHGWLRGERLSKRYVPIEDVAQARRADLAFLIREASIYEPPERR